MRYPQLATVRGSRGLSIPGLWHAESRERIRRRVALALVVVFALIVGWIGGIGWSWSHAREAIVIKSPVFVRHVPAACILDGWDRHARAEDVPAGAVVARWTTDPVRSKGFYPCWPLWEAGEGGAR